MVQAREEPRFPLEARSPLFAFKEFFRQDLYRDLSIEARIPRPVHLAHTPSPQEAEDLERAQPRSCCDRHEFDRILAAKESQVRAEARMRDDAARLDEEDPCRSRCPDALSREPSAPPPVLRYSTPRS